MSEAKKIYYNTLTAIDEVYGNVITNYVKELEQEIIDLTESIAVREFELKKKEDLISELRTELLFQEVEIEELKEQNKEMLDFITNRCLIL